MHILLLGARGQVGWQLQRSLGVLGAVTALDRRSAPHCGDLSRPEDLARSVQQLRPDVIVNAAAWTAVDKAESEADAAHAINASACAVLAREAQALGAWLVHYSTDYVFPGTGERPWAETDATAPVNVYGRTKLAGEQAVAAACERHLIFRTSWVFDSWGQNFLKTILRAASQRESLNVVCDQWGAPTRAALIADVTAQVLGQIARQGMKGPTGLYHLAASGFTHWHAYAQLLVQQAQACGLPVKATPERIAPVPSSAYPTPAARPANSRLDTRRLRETFGLTLPPWQDGVRAVVTELAALTPPVAP